MPITGLVYGANQTSSGYEVANSLRFDDGSSDNLTKSLGTPTSTKIGTFSCWIKLGNITTEQTMLGAYADSSNRHHIEFQADHNIEIFGKASNSTNMELITNAFYRDVSAWQNIVVAYDTSQGTASNRVKLYVNGTQVTSFATETYPNQDTVLQFNTSGSTIAVGRNQGGNYADGYMAEVVFIDGQQLNPTSFGEFDSGTNIWKPIDVSGLTFGTNGFYLDFKNSGSLGADVSGNGNNFTVNNLTSIDQTTDTCTNNFVTLNPLAQTTTKGTVSQGNLEYDRPGSTDSFVSILSTIGASAGKWYAEVKIIDVGSPSQGCVLGFLNLDESNIQSSSSTYLGAATADAGMGWYSVGNVFRQGGHVNIINSYTDNDIVMLAMDLDNGYCYFGKNGSWENSGDPTSGSSGTGGYATSNMTANGTYCFAISLREAGNVQMNFGSPPYSISSGNSDGNGYGNFEYSVPANYYSLCSKNLAEYG